MACTERSGRSTPAAGSIDVFPDRDEASHWYLIPSENRSELEKWIDLPSDDEKSWDTPSYAIPVNRHFTTITFHGYTL